MKMKSHLLCKLKTAFFYEFVQHICCRLPSGVLLKWCNVSAKPSFMILDANKQVTHITNL